MSENKFTPKEAQTFKFQKGDKIPPSQWEKEYWETWEEQGRKICLKWDQRPPESVEEKGCDDWWQLPF